MTQTMGIYIQDQILSILNFTFYKIILLFSGLNKNETYFDVRIFFFLNKKVSQLKNLFLGARTVWNRFSDSTEVLHGQT